MDYEIPFICPILSPRFCFSSFVCPCYLSAVLYARIFRHTRFSFFGFFLVPFSVYGIRRYVQQQMKYGEKYETTILKSTFCPCFSLTQDIHEMHIRRIGIYKYMSEPIPEESDDGTYL